MTIYDILPGKSPAEATAVALGIFDGLHLGHMAVLNALCAGEKKISRCVFTFSTENSKPDAKTGIHLLSARMRDKLLENLGIDVVFQPDFSLFRSMSPEKFARDFLVGYLNARFVFCGENFKFGKNAAANAYDLKNLLPDSTATRIIPMIEACDGVVSSTRIRGLIEDGDVTAAAKLLGRPFTIDFPVEHGRQLGRRLNWPTINQAFPKGFVLPRFGVYASITVADGARRRSVTNIGMKPTVGSGHILAETYIEDFSGDLYGTNTPVELIEFIRDEKKFDSVDELKHQIKKDAAEAAEKLGGKS